MVITGRGNFPFSSRWMNGRKRDTLRKQIFWADTDQSIQTITMDWFFEAAGGATIYSGGIATGIGRGLR
jgi:hypothetical protein